MTIYLVISKAICSTYQMRQNKSRLVYDRTRTVRPNLRSIMAEQVRPNCPVRWPNPEPRISAILTEKIAVFFAKFCRFFQFFILNMLIQINFHTKIWIYLWVSFRYRWYKPILSIILTFWLILNQIYGKIWMEFGRTVRPNLRWKWPNRSGSAEPHFWPFGRTLKMVKSR